MLTTTRPIKASDRDSVFGLNTFSRARPGQVLVFREVRFASDASQDAHF